MPNENDVIKRMAEVFETKLPRVSVAKTTGADKAKSTRKNPMSAVGDMIRGGASGAEVRLAIGTDGQVLVVSGGIPAWEDATGGLLAEQIQDMMATFLVAGANIGLVYDDGANSLTISASVGKYRRSTLVSDPDGAGFVVLSDGTQPLYTLEDLE